MKICFPIDEDCGMQSSISAHFGAAPRLLVVDPDTGVSITFKNGCDPQAHRCSPCRALRGMTLDAVVVDEVGDSCLKVLREYGVRVLQKESDTVWQTLRKMRAGEFSFREALGCAKETDDNCPLNCPCLRYQAALPLTAAMLHPRSKAS